MGGYFGSLHGLAHHGCFADLSRSGNHLDEAAFFREAFEKVIENAEADHTIYSVWEPLKNPS
jgi:hypothetical protein